MSDSVHVLRVPELPDNQQVVVDVDPDGEVIIYMREDYIIGAGAAVLALAMDCARDAYHRAWELPSVLAS